MMKVVGVAEVEVEVEMGDFASILSRLSVQIEVCLSFSRGERIMIER